MEFTEFSAQNRMSGVNFQDVEIRKCAADAVKNYVLKSIMSVPDRSDEHCGNSFIARLNTTYGS